MYIERILYGQDYIYLCCLDITLKYFENDDFIRYDQLFKGDLSPDFQNTIDQLVDDGMVKIERTGYRITLKGKSKLRTGGYKRAALGKRVIFLAVVIAAVAGITAVIIGVFGS